MSETERDPGRIQDMLEAANYVISFVDGLTYEQFLADKIRFFAVMMRHVLVHGYSNILPEILWETAKQDIPELKKMLTSLLPK